MYLHLGQEFVIRQSDVVGIFDIDNSTIKKPSKNFLMEAQKTGRVINVSADLPKSFVVCESGGVTTVYITQISSATLRKRSGFLKGFTHIP